jgi:hypothetical protein
MSKQTGLGDNLYYGGYDISGDVGSLSKISGSQAVLDVTGINKSAHERIGGLRDGGIDFSAFFNPGPSANAAHLVLAPLSRNDAQAAYFHQPSLGGPAAVCVAKEIDYPGTRGNDGSLTFAISMQANGFGLEWGKQLTAGKRTDTAATNGSSINDTPGLTTPGVPASGTPVTNTSGYPVQVVITGGTMTNVSVNGTTVGTGAGTYTLLQGQTITLTYTVAPTWVWQGASAFGFQAYLQVFAFTGTDATVTIQDSSDGTTFANVTGGSFAQITSSTPQAQRIATSNTSTLRQYVRAITTTVGGFTSLTFAVMYSRNPIANVTF